MKKKIKFSNLEFEKRYIWLENLILVTGTHTSGKSMISPVIASLKKVEILRKIYYLDQLANLHFFNKLKFKTAKFMANHILDLSYYEQLIGRNMNFRHEDETSVANSKDPKFFVKRLKVKKGSQILKKHKKINTHMLLDTHDGIWFNKFWLNLGIKNLKIINICRNPIDVVNSWINSDLGEAEKQLLCQIPLISYKKKIKPFYYYKSINKTMLHYLLSYIMQQIPNNEKYERLRRLINSENDTLFYTAPEILHLNWTRLYHILTNHLPIPVDCNEKWKKNISNKYIEILQLTQEENKINE